MTSLDTKLLSSVSRSFGLTLKILPGKIRTQIGLAYLLARMTDTIADTDAVSLDMRLEALQTLRERIMGRTQAPLDFGTLSRRQTSAGEAVLLEQVEVSMRILQSFQPEDLRLVRSVLETITSGQELDLKRFAGASAERIVELKLEEELDDYTYRVAGCVGEFWTKMCLLHLFSNGRVNADFLLSRGVRFGKGLQLVNILRDLPTDLRQGRCYLPEESLSKAGLKAEDLLRPETEQKFRPLYNGYLNRAEQHLLAGWAYTRSLPVGQIRIRLACAWPILIGMETIKLLKTANVLEADKRVKVSREKLRSLVSRSIMLYPLPRAWGNLVPQTTENC